MNISKEIDGKTLVEFEDERRIWITPRADKILQKKIPSDDILKFLRSLWLCMVNIGSWAFTIRRQNNRLTIQVIPVKLEEDLESDV